MKKTLLIISLFIISSVSMQLFSQSLSFGIKGGVNFANMLEQSDFGDFSDSYEYLTGYNLGLYVEASASADLIGEAGIGLATFGYQIKTETAEAYLKSNFLIIPLKAKTVYNLGLIDVFASGGVYAGWGLSGSMYLNTDITGEIEEDIVWGDDSDADMVRLDYGVVGSAGLIVKGVVLELGYYHGLANLKADPSDDYVMSNRAFTISLGYMYSF